MEDTFRGDRRLLESPRVTIILESMTKKFNRFRGSRPFRGIVLLIIKFSSFRPFRWMEIACHQTSKSSSFRDREYEFSWNEGERERRWILDLVKLHEENCKARKRSNVSSPSHSRELFRFHLELGYLRWICRNAMSLKCIGVSPLHQSMAEY